MAGSDSMKFNSLEKLVSQDFNDAQALQARAAADQQKHASAQRLNGLNAAAHTENVQPVIAGLQVVPNGNNVTVQPGYLTQDSASLAPTPGSLDSSYRVAFNRSNLTVAAPAPGSDTYYLLEAQMQEVVALNESRKVLNTTTRNFGAAALDKRLERTVATQWVAGSSTTYPAPSGGNWVVLAGVFRPAGGGGVNFAHVVDMRLLPGSHVPDNEGHYTIKDTADVSNLNVTVAAPTLVTIAARARSIWNTSDGGLQMYAKVLLGAAPAGVDVNVAAIKESTLGALSADTWYYLYLVPWSNLLPRMYYGSAVVTRGVLVLSATAPDTSSVGCVANSAALNMPAPFSGTAAIRTATLVAALRRDSAGTGWVPVVGGNGHYRIAAQGSTIGVLLDSGSASPRAITASMLPAGAKMMRFAVNFVVSLPAAPGTNGDIGVDIRTAGGGTSTRYTRHQVTIPEWTGARSLTHHFEMEAPYDPAGLDFNLFGSGVDTITTFSVRLVGYTM